MPDSEIAIFLRSIARRENMQKRREIEVLKRNKTQRDVQKRAGASPQLAEESKISWQIP